MDDEWRNVERGERLATSDWGGATINGTDIWTLVRLEVFERGVLVRVHPMFATGALWIPADEARLSTVEQPGLYGNPVERNVLRGSRHRVVLSPALAEPAVLSAIRWARFNRPE